MTLALQLREAKRRCQRLNRASESTPSDFARENPISNQRAARRAAFFEKNKAMDGAALLERLRGMEGGTGSRARSNSLSGAQDRSERRASLRDRLSSSSTGDLPRRRRSTIRVPMFSDIVIQKFAGPRGPRRRLRDAPVERRDADAEAPRRTSTRRRRLRRGAAVGLDASSPPRCHSGSRVGLDAAPPRPRLRRRGDASPLPRRHKGPRRGAAVAASPPRCRRRPRRVAVVSA